MITIYAIRNNENPKHYIGCTAGKPQKRWREHRCLLRANKHTCRELQSDWNRFGEAAFRLEILEQAEAPATSDKRRLELKWFEAIFDLYNGFKISFEPPPTAHTSEAIQRGINRKREMGYKPSPESNLKRRLAQLGIPKGHGAKISATKQAKRRDSLLCTEKQGAEVSDKEPMR